MNKEQEYIKFWTGIMDKIDKIEKDYAELSNENKIRVNNVRELIIHAHTVADVIQIVRLQVEK